MPAAYHNPNDKCWLNALMVALTVYRPFQDTLASTETSGPVTEVLKAHFKQPVLCRGKPIVDTAKLMSKLRNAVQEHLGLNPDSFHGKNCFHMLNNTGYHDPGEFWNSLQGVVCDELEISHESSRIGAQVNEIA